MGPRRLSAARRRSRVRRDSVQELPRGGAEPECAERVARLSARRDRRPQGPEPVPGRDPFWKERAAPEGRLLNRPSRLPALKPLAAAMMFALGLRVLYLFVLYILGSANTHRFHVESTTLMFVACGVA